MICLVDERISERCERGLLLRGFRPIKMKRAENLGTAVASHPDMLVFCHGGTLISSAEYCESCSYIFSDIREGADIKMIFTSDSFKSEYPYDAIFNAKVIGEHIYLKEDTVSSAVKDYAEKAGLKTVAVKQGYPACTVLSFGCSAVTADRGMCDALTTNGIKVTLIENGDISLPPYEYGFIGGASGVFGGVVYFAGDLKRHRDHEAIEAAIAAEGYTFVSLSDEELADIGGIIFIDENIDRD